MRTALNVQFDEVLESLGPEAADFFLAASLYQAHKISFSAAAHLASLSFSAFNERLKEHFSSGFKLADEVIASDLETLQRIQATKK